MSAPTQTPQQASHSDFLIDLDEAVEASRALIGVKGWYLAQLRLRGFAAPAGVVLTTDFYRQAIHDGRVDRQLDDIWESAKHAKPAQIQTLARRARHLISELRIDAEYAQTLASHLEAFGKGAGLAVRSSAPPDAVSGPECAGVHATFTNVVGADQVISRLHGCWASLFGERALAMRARGLGSASPSMAVVVQPMMPADKSGIAIPIGHGAEVLVEATFGLGEPIVSGAVEPDRYVIDASTARMQSVTIGRKQIVLPSELRRGHEFALLDQQEHRVLDDAELLAIGELSTQVDQKFGSRHEIEWVFTRTDLRVVQVRPVEKHNGDSGSPNRRVASGIGIGLGAATGRVRIIDGQPHGGPNDLANIESGDVVVATSTAPAWRPLLARAGAIITDEGDEYSHAALVAREFGIPAVVGASSVTTDLVEGVEVTVDALHGCVY